MTDWINAYQDRLLGRDDQLQRRRAPARASRTSSTTRPSFAGSDSALKPDET